MGGKPTEAQKRANKKYDAVNTIQIHLKLNKNTDTEIIEKLEQVESKQRYIKKLILEDIRRDSEQNT